MLRQKITELQEHVVDLQDKVKKLEGELDKCINGDPNKDIQQIGRWKDIREGDYSATIIIFKNIKSNKYYKIYQSDQLNIKASPVEIRVLTYNRLKKIHGGVAGCSVYCVPAVVGSGLVCLCFC